MAINFLYLIDKNSKFGSTYKSLHSVDLRPNYGTWGHFQIWHPPLSFLKHIKVHYEHGLQTVLKRHQYIFQCLDGLLQVISELQSFSLTEIRRTDGPTDGWMDKI